MAFSCDKVVIFVMSAVLLVGTCMIETAQARKVAISRHYRVRTTEPRLLSEKETESNLLRKNGDDDHKTNKDENNKPSTSWGKIFEDEKVHIGNGVMTRDLPYCGPNNKNCGHKASNPYNRGCNQGERCRGHPRANAGLKSVGSKNNDDDHDDDEKDEENKITIGNGAMSRDQRDCGPNNKNCKNKDPANTYTRGCNPGERCRGRPSDEEKTESKTGEHDDEEDDEKRSTKSKPDYENKVAIGNGVMRRDSPYCGPLSNGRCHQKQPANEYNRGCNPGEKCRGH